MSPTYAIELFGGKLDGRRALVSDAHIRDGYVLLPREPVMTLTCEPDGVVSFAREKYEWDGTKTRKGFRRFRATA